MAVVDDYATDGAELALIGFPDGFGVAGVPRGFVVDGDIYVMLAGGVLDSDSVGEGGGEGLLDHGGDAAVGGGFNDFAVVLNAGVDEDGIGVKLVERLVEIGEKELLVEVELCGVLCGEGGVGLGDA